MAGNTLSPRAPLHRQWPAVSLLTLLLILTISHIYLQLAYPLHAVGLAAGLAILAAGLLLIPTARETPTPRTTQIGTHNLYFVALAIQAAWLAWNGIALLRAPVDALGRTAFATIFQGSLVFWIVAEAARRWPHLPPPESPHAADAPRTPPHTQGITAPQIVGFWWAAAAVLLALYGLYQVWGPAGWPKTFATLYQQIRADYGTGTAVQPTVSGVLHALQEKRAFATFGAPNIFAGFLVGGLALVLGFGFSAGSARGRLGAVAAGIPLVLALVLSQSRGGFLAALFVCGWFLLRWWRGSIRVRKISAAVLLAAVLLLPRLPAAQRSTDSPTSPATAAPSVAETTSPRDTAAHRTLLEHLSSVNTVRQRLYYWQTALALWARAPFTGMGIGTYEVFYPSLRRPGAGETVYAHNWFFQYGAETGLVGLSIFLATVVLGLVSGERAIRGLAHSPRTLPCHRPRPGLLIAFEAALLGLLVHGLVDYTLSQRELYLDFQLVLGMLVGSSACLATLPGRAAGTSKPETTHPAAGSVRRRRVATTLLVAGILAAGGWIYFETVIAPLLARFYSVAARDVATETGDLEAAAQLYRKAVRWEPDQPWNLAALGLVRLDQGNPAGLQRIQQAIALHPRSASLQASLARAYERLGMPEEALQALRRAVELHPLDPTHRMDLAEALLAREQPEEAAAQLAAARQVPLLPEQEQRLEALASRVNTPTPIRQ